MIFFKEGLSLLVPSLVLPPTNAAHPTEVRIISRYWHFPNLKSISFNFCLYTFFRLKPRYGVLLTFSWNLDHFSTKIDKEHNFFHQLPYIHTRYWHFLNLKSISFNFCSYTFFRLKPHYGVMLKFSWNLDHFPPQNQQRT